MVDRFGLPLDEEEEVVEMTNIFTIPTTFERCMSPEEQLLWLFMHKQDNLKAGDNVTLTRNEDGTVTISVSGTLGSTYRISEVTPDEGYVAAYALIDIQTGHQSGVKIQIPEGGQGEPGVGIKSIVGSVGSTGTTVTVTLTDDTTQEFFVERGIQGIQGEPGQDGSDGADGISPEVTITSITGGHEVTITDADHPSGQSFNVMDGADGAAGQPGQDGTNGISPEVTISTITGGHRVTITDADHPLGQSFDVMDGNAIAPNITAQATVGSGTGTPTVNVTKSGTADAPIFTFAFDNLKGADGQDGSDGISPTVTVAQRVYGYHITIVSAGGTEEFDIYNGTDGTDGTDGVSPTVTVRTIAGGHQIEIVSAGGTERFDVMDGVDGQNGTNGTDGTDGTDGISPEVTIATITGGHRVTITDADHPSGQSFDVMDGATGAQGPAGQDGTNGTDGVSPTVSITSITGGHTVTITDAQGQHPFNVMDGTDGATGATGPAGPAGPGVPTGGTAGQVLSKVDGTDYNTEWITPSGGSGLNSVSISSRTGTTTATGIPAPSRSVNLFGKIYFDGNTIVSETIDMTAAIAFRFSTSSTATYGKIHIEYDVSDITFPSGYGQNWARVAGGTAAWVMRQTLSQGYNYTLKGIVVYSYDVSVNSTSGVKTMRADFQIFGLDTAGLIPQTGNSYYYFVTPYGVS